MEKLKLIGVRKNTKDNLDKLKEYERETYDDVISRLLNKKG